MEFYPKQVVDGKRVQWGSVLEMFELETAAKDYWDKGKFKAHTYITVEP